jgi:hypothetical protein
LKISSTDGPVKSARVTDEGILPEATSSDHSGGTNKTLAYPLITDVWITLQNKPLIWTVMPFENDANEALSHFKVTTIPTCGTSGFTRIRPFDGTGHPYGLIPALPVCKLVKGIRSSSSKERQSPIARAPIDTVVRPGLHKRHGATLNSSPDVE